MSPPPAQRLVSLRKRLGLSQRELAKEFGVSSGAVALWETGERAVPGPILKLLDLYEAEGHGDASPEVAAEMEALRAAFARSSLQGHLVDGFQTFVADHLSLNAIRGRVLAKLTRQGVHWLRDSKGISVKLAQLASFVEIGLPVEVRTGLESLSARQRPMSQDQVRRVLLGEFGQGPEALFESWSAEPLAVTSVGQVHAARLHEGDEVVVKIQHPNIRKILDDQFWNVDWMVRISALFRHRDSSLLEDLKEKIYAECDYRLEAEHQRRFAVLVAGEKNVIVPKVFDRYSTGKVLTSERVFGEDFETFKTTASSERKNAAALAIHRALGLATFRSGLMHGDPQPGNFLFTEDKVAVLDFGRMILYPVERLEVENGFIHAFLNDRLPLAKQKLLEMDSVVRPETFDFDGFWRFLQAQQVHYFRPRFAFSRDHLASLAANARRYAGRDRLKMTKWFFWSFFINTSLMALFAELEAEGPWRDEMLGALLETAGA